MIDSVVIFPKSVLVLVENILASKKCSSLLHTIFSKIFEKASRMLIGL